MKYQPMLYAHQIQNADEATKLRQELAGIDEKLRADESTGSDPLPWDERQKLEARRDELKRLLAEFENRPKGAAKASNAGSPKGSKMTPAQEAALWVQVRKLEKQIDALQEKYVKAGWLPSEKTVFHQRPGPKFMPIAPYWQTNPSDERR